MAKPTTRDEFAEYVLRKLGKPVIEINVSDEQVSDRIDEALEYYHDYHFDGSEHEYFKYQITQTDIDNEYITLPEGLEPITIMNPPFGMSSGMFNVEYQYMLNNLHTIANGGVSDLVMNLQNLRMLEDVLQGLPRIDFNRHTDRLYIRDRWDKFEVGQYIVIEGYRRLDTATYSDVWSDRWLQNYAAAKIKYQWGSNLTKFEGMQLPGGVTFNGQQILSDAEAHIRELEDEMISSYSIPINLFVG